MGMGSSLSSACETREVLGEDREASYTRSLFSAWQGEGTASRSRGAGAWSMKVDSSCDIGRLCWWRATV